MQNLGPRRLNRALNRSLVDKGGAAGVFASAPLDLRFALQKTLDPRITFTRASSGTFVDSSGVLRSAATNESRFDHNPTTGESLGLLVEEARTNSIANNTGVGVVAGTPGTLPTNWTWNTTGGASSEVVGTGTENGISYVDVRLFGTTTSVPSIQFCANTAIAAVQNQTWTESFYCKVISGTIQPTANARLIERSSAGSYLTEGNVGIVPGASSVPLGRSRFTFTRTLANASTAYVVPAILFNYIGTVDFTLRIGLPQLEQGAFVTSVIPTTSATVTRAADVASITGSNFSSFYNQTEGTVFAEASSYMGSAAVSRGVVSIDGAAGDVHRIFRQSDLQPVAQTLVSNTSQATFGFGATWSTAALKRISYAYAVNNFAGSVDGGAIQTDTTGALPATSTLNIGTISGSNQFGGTIKRLTYWPVRLADTTLQQITQS